MLQEKDTPNQLTNQTKRFLERRPGSFVLFDSDAVFYPVSRIVFVFVVVAVATNLSGSSLLPVWSVCFFFFFMKRLFSSSSSSSYTQAKEEEIGDQNAKEM